MRLINLDDILKQFPKADFDGDDLENMKAYPHWKTDVTGLFTILKSVPIIEPCEDAISREDVMKCFKKWQPYMATRLWDYEQELKDLPSVTPSYNSIKTELEQQPKIGKWILGGGYWRCLECKEKALLKLDKSKGNCREYMPIKSNYCPNCGAKMEAKR